MSTRVPDADATDLEAFAAAVAHELRTPLSALSGEVELALRRDRTQAGYREALSRIAQSVGELIDLTGDLSLLGESSGGNDIAARSAHLDVIVEQVADRYRSVAADVLRIERAVTAVAVAGDERLLARALALLVEHAVRYRRDGACVRLHAASPDDLNVKFGPVDLVLEAQPGGFRPQAWQFLTGDLLELPDARRLAPGPLRLRTAERIVRDCGGSLTVSSVNAAQVVQIRLRCAEGA